MPDYLLIYHGGRGMTPSRAEQEKTMEVWMEWFKRLGKAVVEIGAPTGPAKTVTKAGARGKPRSGAAGYSVIRANSLSAAANLAKSHPDVQRGMKIEVYELEKI